MEDQIKQLAEDKSLGRSPLEDQPIPRRVCVLGAGASGLIVSAQLLHRLGFGDDVVLVHRESSLGLGTAYATNEVEHRLNVRAHNMSAYADHPSHFVEWLADRGVGETVHLNEMFISRTVYGEYLWAVLEEIEGASLANLHTVQDEAVAIERERENYRISLGSGSSILATHVVFATGHLGPKLPKFLEPLRGNPRFKLSTWANELDSVDPKDEDILIIGTGLTMVDAMLSLSNKLANNRVYARSRRGLMPHPHRPGPKPPVIQVDEPVSEIRSLARQIICQGRSAGPDWRAVVDGCRSLTTKWWKSLDWEQRARFLQRLQPYWDTHRHRIPDEVYAMLQQMQIEDRLDVAPAANIRIEPMDDGFKVILTRPNGVQETLTVGWILNCTGPETDFVGAKLPLYESAVAAGLASYDPLGLGLLIDDQHLTATGERIFAIGPVCRGCLWETTAIPEIRVQAELIATECAG